MNQTCTLNRQIRIRIRLHMPFVLSTNDKYHTWLLIANLLNSATAAWTVFFFATQKTISSINMFFFLLFNWNDFQWNATPFFLVYIIVENGDFFCSTYCQSFCQSQDMGSGIQATIRSMVSCGPCMCPKRAKKDLNKNMFRWIWALKRTGGIQLNASQYFQAKYCKMKRLKGILLPPKWQTYICSGETWIKDAVKSHISKFISTSISTSNSLYAYLHIHISIYPYIRISSI